MAFKASKINICTKINYFAVARPQARNFFRKKSGGAKK
jgi:hypothetical protein